MTASMVDLVLSVTADDAAALLLQVLLLFGPHAPLLLLLQLLA